MSIYLQLQGVAKELLEHFDQSGITLIKLTPGGGPAHNPGEPTKVNHRVEGVARGVSQRFVDGSHVIASDLQFTVAGGGFEPTVSDEALIGSKPHEIVRVIRTPATGAVVSYTVIIRS